MFCIMMDIGYEIPNWLKIGFCWIHEILSEVLFKFQNRSETIQIDLLSHQKSINQNRINKKNYKT